MPYAVIMEWDADWETHLKIDAAIGDGPVEGLVVHTAGPSESGTRVLDVWETKHHSTAFFRDRVVPALASLGLEAGPPLSVTEYEMELIRP